MLYVLKNPKQVPPDGFRYKIDEVILKGFTLKNLLEKVVLYYYANKLEMPEDLEAQVVSQMCENLPDVWCKSISEGFGDSVRRFTQITGIHAKVKQMHKRRGRTGCSSCGQRQVAWNKKVPYKGSYNKFLKENRIR